jgi:hypothetical protein
MTGKAKFRVSDALIMTVLDMLPEGTNLIHAEAYKSKHVQEALDDPENWRRLPAMMKNLSQQSPNYLLTIEHPDLPMIDPVPEYSCGIDVKTGKWVWGSIIAQDERS